MSFFEPIPPSAPPGPRAWSAPLWDRPSEGVLPAAVPVNALLHRDEAVAVELDVVRAYPNGFTINFAILMNPHTHPGGLREIHEPRRPCATVSSRRSQVRRRPHR